MEKKFTKGKWHNLEYRVDVDIADGLSGICEMSNWMDKKEMEANAKLIAAAPEMIDILSTIENDNGGIPDWLWKRIKDVIKKATK